MNVLPAASSVAASIEFGPIIAQTENSSSCDCLTLIAN